MRFILSILLVIGLSASASSAFAQKSDTPQVDTNQGLSFPKPDGWVEKKASKGVVVRLEAAGDSGSRIELRVAPDVDAKRAKTFFASFHSSLQAAGLKKVSTTSAKKHGEHAGQETEYETKGKGGEAFRLVIWQIHRGERAWMLVGFFDARERDTLYQDYTKLIASFVFD